MGTALLKYIWGGWGEVLSGGKDVGPLLGRAGTQVMLSHLPDLGDNLGARSPAREGGVGRIARAF